MTTFGRLRFASVETGLNAVETSIRLYLLAFYVDVAGLRPALAGAAIALGLVFDAVTDPLAGGLSDRLRDRFGGRSGWIAAGSALTALGGMLLFQGADDPATQGSLFFRLLGSYLVLSLGMTLVAVPHAALVTEVSHDRHERSALMGWRFALGNLGTLVAAGLPAAMSVSGDTTVGGVAAMPRVAVVLAGLMILSGLVTAASTRRVATRDRSPVETGRHLWASFTVPLGDAAFRPLLLAGVLATVGIGINAATALHYYGYRLGLASDEIRLILIVFVFVFSATIPGWVAVSRRFGKNRPLSIGACTLGIATSIVYPTLPEGAVTLTLWVSAVGLGAMVGCVVLVDSLVTDVVDLRLLKSGRPDAGAYFGVWRFIQKLARAIALVAVGLVLDGWGFEAGSAIDPDAGQALALLFGPGVGTCFIATGLVIGRYRFRDPDHARVQALLQRRSRRQISPR